MPMVLPWVTAVPEVFFSISSAGCHSGETAGENTTLTPDETSCSKVLFYLTKVKTDPLPCGSTNFTCRGRAIII